MGCTHSQPDPDEESRSGARPPPAPSSRRLHDIRRHRFRGRPARKDLFASSAEPLTESSDIDAEDDLRWPKSPRGPTAASGHPVPTTQPVPLPWPRDAQEEAEKGKKKARFGPRLVEEGKGLGKADEEEQSPGSPSFRFYFEGPWVDKDSAEAADHVGKDQGKIDEMKEDNLHLRDDTVSQDTEGKSSKKDKGKRFKAISKGSSVVYNSLKHR